MKLLEGRLAVEDVDGLLDTLNAVAEAHGVTIQAFDAGYVADRRHLERAIELADRAIERGENVARDEAVEMLLYAAGRRQIDRALEMGVCEGERPVVIAIDGRCVDGREADARAAVLDSLPSFDRASTLDRTDETTLRSFFDIDDAELAATDASLAELVHERVALLDVEK